MTSASESIQGHSLQPWFASGRSLLAMLLVGFLQGLLLLFVAEGVRGGDSAVEDFRLLAPLYAIAFGVPIAFLLCFTGASGRRPNEARSDAEERASRGVREGWGERAKQRTHPGVESFVGAGTEPR